MTGCQLGQICLTTAPGVGVCAPACQLSTQCIGGEICEVGYCRPVAGTVSGQTPATGQNSDTFGPAGGVAAASPTPMDPTPEPGTPTPGMNPAALPMGGMPMDSGGNGNPMPVDPLPGNPGNGGNTPPMGQTCVDFGQCLIQCGEADQACQQMCIGQYPAEIVQQ